MTRWQDSAVSVVESGQMCRSWTSLTPGMEARCRFTAARSTESGTPATAMVTAWRRMPQVANRITALTTRLTTGSTHSQPVSEMTNPATTTAADTPASANMCMKAAWTLRSPLRPEANSMAVAPLTTMPSAATAMTMPATTGWGWISRCTASHAMAPTASSNSRALNSAARMELWPSPKV